MSGSDNGFGGDGGLRDLGESAIEGLLERVGRGVSKVQERRPLAYDLLESEEAYLAVFDAPGTTNSDIQVQFREDAVEVKVDRFREFHEEFEMRFPGRGLSLDGTAELPEDASVDPTGAEATLAENGTLRVRIPKDEDDGPVDVAEESEADDDGPESIELDEHTEDHEEADDHDADHEEADDHDADHEEADGDHDADADSHEEDHGADGDEHDGHDADHEEADDDHDTDHQEADGDHEADHGEADDDHDADADSHEDDH